MAVIVIATMPLYVVNSRTVIFDIALAFFVSAAIFAGYRAEACEGKSRRNWYLLGALAAGLATLVKGPVGFLIPGLVLLVFHRVEGRRGVWKRLLAPLNLLVFFGVTLPWFIGLSRQHPDFPYYGLIEESFHRFTTVKFHRAQPFYFYALIVAGMFLPWSFVLPEAGWVALKNRLFKSPADRLCLVWAVVVVIFFSLSKSKMPGYILSATVACGILLARFFERAMANPDGKALRMIGRAAITLAILCLAAAGAGIYFSTHLKPLAGPLGIPPGDAEELSHHLISAIILLLAFAGLGLLARFRRDAGLAFISFALFPLLLLATNLSAIGLVFNAKSARQLAQQFPALPPQTELACLECYPCGLPFYLGRTATLITVDGREFTSNYILFRLKNDPQWPANVVASTNLDRWIAQQNHPVYLIASVRSRPRVEAAVGTHKTEIQTLTPSYIGVFLPAQ
jgi:4-amino-4-deoxy-L-arabinose transferase-like glycosyltransferase